MTIAACHLQPSTQRNHHEQKISVAESPGNEPQDATPSASLAAPSIETISATEKRVRFAGVSCVYDASIISEMKAEIVPALPLRHEDDQPDTCYPKQIRFCFPNEKAAEEVSSFCRPNLTVFTIDDFKQTYSVAKYLIDAAEKILAFWKDCSLNNQSHRKQKFLTLNPLMQVRLFILMLNRLNFKTGKGCCV